MLIKKKRDTAVILAATSHDRRKYSDIFIVLKEKLSVLHIIKTPFKNKEIVKAFYHNNN